LMRNYPELCLVTIRRMMDIIHPLSQNNDSWADIYTAFKWSLSLVDSTCSR
jgi:hypothetical protein